MARNVAASSAVGIKLSAVGDTHLSAGEVYRLNRRPVRMIMVVVTLSAIAVVSQMVAAFRREAVSVGATPFQLCMTRRGTISRDAVVFYSAQLDRA